MRKSWTVICAGLAGFLAVACGDDEAGKYTTGPDDPARKVTDKDLAQVKSVLEKQRAEDIAKGLRREAPAAEDPHAAHAGTEMASNKPGAGAPAGAGASGAASAPGVVQLRSIYVRTPEGWTSAPPSTSMRLGEFAIPAAAGDEGGEVSVTWFGPDAGGIEANIARWIGQMKQTDGSDSKDHARTESFQARGMKVTLLDVSGVMDAPAMPGVPSKGRKEGWRLLGGIVESPDGPYFFKGVGPEKTMAANREKMVDLLRSASSTPPAETKLDLHGRPPEEKQAAPPQTAQPAPAAAPPAPPAASGAAPAMPAAAAADGLRVKIRQYTAALPEGWKSVPPASSMREAEFSLAAAPGDPEPGQMAVFYFGPEAGGVSANIDRWIGQFSQPDGSNSADKAKVEDLKAGDVPVKLVDLTGTMAASNMPGAPAGGEKANWRLLGAIAMTGEGPYFFKATGPAKTMAAQRDAMIAFMKSLAPASGAAASAPAPAPAEAPAAPPAAPPMPAQPPASAPAPPAPAVSAPAPPMPASPAAPAQAPAPAAAGGAPVELQSLAATLPAGWKQVPPASSMRMAEFQLPASAGDPEPGTIAVFYFGPDGGGIEANLDRWYGQFSQPDGRASKGVAVRESIKAGGMDAVLVDLTGTMAASNMPGAPSAGEKANWRLIGAIVSGPDGPYFLKGTGPAKTMGENRDLFIEFVKSMRKK